MLSRRNVLKAGTGLVAASALGAPAIAQGARVTVQFWHGLAQPLGGLLEAMVQRFNESQTQFTVVPTFRGSYVETMNAAIAAFRAGNAPHIVQMFEVGTATMMGARGAIKPVHELLSETGVNLDPNQYLPGVRGYYSLPNGNLVSMPFNSSTTVMWYNKQMVERAGHDPNNLPTTMAQLRTLIEAMKSRNVAEVPFSSAWITWAQLEQFSSIHDVPFATKQNGFEGLDTELQINSALHKRHMGTLVDWQRSGHFRYGGRDNVGEPAFVSGQCAIMATSSGFRARAMRETPGGAANVAVGFLPYYNDHTQNPLNSIIGGASLWVMNSRNRSRDEFRAVAEFFRYISVPANDARWHQETGYVPITLEGFALTRQQGFYAQNPFTDLPIQQLTRGGRLTPNSRGLRLGGLVEIRVIIQEELERAFQGQITAAQAMDNAVTRGNVVLRNFERANRG